MNEMKRYRITFRHQGRTWQTVVDAANEVEATEKVLTAHVGSVSEIVITEVIR